MASFKYTGRDESGQQISGLLEAGSHALAARELQQKNIILTSLFEESATAEKTTESIFSKSLLPPKKITLDDQVLLTRQLYALTKAGIPIIRALNGLAESRHQGIRKIGRAHV